MRKCLLGLLGVLAISALPARSDDWPQWLGPQRDGVWREAGLLTEFPKQGLTVKWRVPINGGYAGPAVANGRVFVTDHILKPDVQRPTNAYKRITQAGSERVLCFDEASGKSIWKYEYDCPYGMSYSMGPRSTPAVDGDRVYTLGAEGDLLCLATETGKVIWSKHLATEASPTSVWGFSSHPLVDGNKLICTATGRDAKNGLGVVTAFNKMTGEMIWTALAAKQPGYSAPEIIKAGGVRQLIVWHPEAINGLDPETGKVYWTVPVGPANQGLTIMTPRFYHDPALGDLLMVATQYEGSAVIKLDPKEPKAELFWKRGGKSDKKTEALHSVIAMPTLRDGHIYGVCIKGELRCLDAKNGDRLWSTFDATTYGAGQQQWATAFLIPLGDTGTRFLIANEHGDLILADLDPQGYHQISKAHLIEPTNTDPQRAVVWSFPALANRCVFWRNDKEMVCASMAGKQ